MKKHTRLYVGVTGLTSSFRIFRSANEPTAATHGREFAMVIGPFRTLPVARNSWNAMGALIRTVKRWRTRKGWRAKHKRARKKFKPNNGTMPE